jgi:hypothetical protein
MIKHIVKTTSIAIFLLASHSILVAQLNIIGGYEGGYTPANNYNDILNQYKLGQDSLQKSFGSYNLMNGMAVGLSYRTSNNISFEAIWSEKPRNLTARGVNPATGRSFTNTLKTRLRTITFSAQTHFDNFVIGAGVSNDVMRLRYGTNTTEEEILFTESRWAGRFYAGFFVKASPFLSISLRPYVQVPIGSLDFTNLEKTLNKSERKVEENLSYFGITLLLYNGSQKNQRY